MAKAMKAMKAMAAMKAMRAMKKKAVSKIAKGKMARAVVFRGTKKKTYTGLTKGDLIKNKQGKIVSKKASALAKKRYATSVKGWNVAVQKAISTKSSPLTTSGAGATTFSFRQFSMTWTTMGKNWRHSTGAASSGTPSSSAL